MKTFYTLRGPETDGTQTGGGAGGAQTPAAPASPTAPATSVVDMWGGTSAPDWAKQAGVTKAHDKANEAVGKASPTQDNNGVAPAKPDTVVPEVTPTPVVTPTATPAQVVQPVTPTPAAQSVAGTVTPEAIAQAFAQIQQTQRGPDATQTPRLSEAELAQQLGVFNADEGAYESAFGVKPTPTQLAAYNAHLQNIAKQAVTVGQILVQNAMAQREQQFRPYAEAIRTAEASRQLNTFYSDNADLKGYEPLVEKEYTAMKAAGISFPNADLARKALADRTRETLKSIGITPKAASAAPTTTTATSPQAARKMTTTSVGGRSGSSATPAGKADTNKAVWG